MPRMTITLSEQRQQALREAAARRGTTIAAIIDESLEACGVKSWQEAEDLVAQARARAILTEDEAVDLAVRETSAVRRVKVLRETSTGRETSSA
jgi:hypothetical protein